MKKIFFFISVLITQHGFTQGTWVQKATFPGNGRQHPFSFSIGTKGYVGAGVDATNTYSYTDFWEYNTGSNTWSQKADFLGVFASPLVGFSVNGKGYAGGIWKDFWEYNPGANSWTRKADFGGALVTGSRTYAAAFAIGNKGYIGTGYSGVSTSFL